MTKFNVTRKEALNSIITFARDNGYDNQDVLAVVDNMLSKLSTSNKVKTETKAHYQNAGILQNNLHLFSNGTILTAREFANLAKNFPIDNMGRPSIHKATAVLAQGVKEDILIKIIPQKKNAPTLYALKEEEEDSSINAD